MQFFKDILNKIRFEIRKESSEIWLSAREYKVKS